MVSRDISECTPGGHGRVQPAVQPDDEFQGRDVHGIPDRQMILIKTDHVHRGRLFSGAVLLVTPENAYHFPKNTFSEKKTLYNAGTLCYSC